jgi:hypothetical protein
MNVLVIKSFKTDRRNFTELCLPIRSRHLGALKQNSLEPKAAVMFLIS